MAQLGLELTPSQIRAVRRGWRGALETLEVPWNPEAPSDAVELLRARFGTGAASVRLAIDPTLLRVKALQLPEVASGEQWRAIALQPARYFAEQTDTPLAVAWHGESRLAFAIDAARLQHWVREFSTLGAVTAMLPSPLAIAATSLPDGTYAVASTAESVATATISGSRLTAARVARRGNAGPVHALPPYGMLGGEWRAAGGAASSRVTEDWESLTTTHTQRGLRRRRMRGIFTAAAACVVALIAALAALDFARSTYEARLDRAIAAAEQDAQPGLALRRRLAGLEREAQVLRAPSSTLDAVQTLAVISELLPREIVVTRLRMTGDEWQASGRAHGGRAASIVPALERDRRFIDVRLTSPSTRFREDAQQFESFSVAFRVRPTD
ncbi:MAG TPA: PilN domain-containing protein [Gemmatimonadaceae bacterium]|jgi:hypothetical protein